MNPTPEMNSTLPGDATIPPGFTPVDGEFFFLEAGPDRPRATLTRVEAWDDADAPGPRTRGYGGGRILEANPNVGTADAPATEAFVAGYDRLEGLPATWWQMFVNSAEVPAGGGSRDVSEYLRFVGVEPLPAGCRVLPGPDGSVEVNYPDGQLRTIHRHPAA